MQIKLSEKQTTKNWEITHYKEQRKPHDLFDTIVAVSRSFNQDFTCPICLELLKNKMAHSNKFLRIYITNHLNLTLNYRIIRKVVANIDFI